MRISTQMMQRLAVSSMLDRQADLSKTQQQLATGRRILTPADDPSGTTQILSLKQQLAQNEQYSSNIDRLKSRLEAEEAVLDSVGNAIQRLRELAVQGMNVTYDAQNRQSLASEVWLLLDEVLSLANSKDGNGEYLFSGFQSDTQPFVDNGAGVYTYQGDQAQRHMQISPTRAIQSSDSGSEVFENIPVVAGGKQNLFRTIYDFAMSLETNSPTVDSQADLDYALNNIATVRAKIGARTNAIDAQAQINAHYDVQVNSILSGVQDLDYAEAVSRMNLELVGLQAAQQTFQKIQGLSLFNYL